MTAAEKILQKALVGSNINSSQWNRIQAGLRDRAFFSSTVEKTKMLHSMRGQVAAVAAGKKSASEVRRDLRQAFSADGYTPKPGEEGTIKDLYTKRRLDTVIDTNVRQARGFVQYMDGISPGALSAFPAQELVRVRDSKEKRDWVSRWRKAGGVLRAGRMVALKTDPVWTKLSVFGNPFPPFDWGSGMGLRDIKRSEAKSLGLVLDEAAKEKAAKSLENVDLNGSLEATVPGMRSDSPEARKLKEAFGDQIQINNGIVEWQGSLIKGILNGTVKKATLGKGYDGSKLSLSHQFFIEHGNKHLDPSQPYAHLTPDEFELLPSLWRKPDRILPTRDPNRVQLELDLLDGGVLMMIVDRRNGLKSIQKRMSPKGSTA